MPNVTIRREIKGRRGKQVTTLSGLAYLGEAKLADLASDLKRLCGTGGTVEAGGTILLQGDRRDAVQAALEKRGFTVKRAGG
jgi:translation initiation factor 1